MRILIKNGHVLDPKNNIDECMDIYIEDGNIVQIEKDIDLGRLESIEVIDATNLTVAPGLVDMHCHLRDPGFEYKEDIETGTRSAAMGGFTSIACMPNTSPVIDNQSVVEYILSKSKSVGVVNVYPIGAITKGLKGEELSEIGELKFAGVVAVSDDGKPVEDAQMMKNALKYAAMFDTPVISHCEEKSLSCGAMNEGYMSTYLGLGGISRACEELMVARDVILAKTYNVPVHIAHVSTTGSVEIIRHAKSLGTKVTCETCPHYFTLTENAVEGFDTNAKMNPPLRTKEDVDAIIAGLVDGTIDVIATDHAPHHADEKNLEFDLALNGIVGFETALSLGITYLVKPGHLSLSCLIEKMSSNPAKILGLNKGQLDIDKNADIVIFDSSKKRTVCTKEFLSKSKNSPYDGYELDGTVEYTIVVGKIVVRQGMIL